MNLATIAIKNTRRNAVRSLSTVFAVAIAILAFLLLRTVAAAWETAVEYSAQDRVITRHRVSFFQRIPLRYIEQIKQVPGVQGVTAFTWFGGHVPGREDQFFGNQAVEPESFLRVYDEVVLEPEERDRFLQDRQGAIVGWKLARQFGWKVGDRVQLEGTIFPGTWEFNVAGIYTTTRPSTDPSSFYFRLDYLNESLRESAKDQVGWFCAKVPSASEAGVVSQRIDKLFEPRDVQTLSMSEQSMRASFMGMLAALTDGMKMAGIVILFIMTLILGNTIAMGVRERTREYGVLRAVGFLPKHVTAFVLGEAAVLGLVGGVVGLAIAYPLINIVLGGFIDQNYAGTFPHFRIPQADLVLVLLLSVVLAIAAALLPGLSVRRMHVTEALRNLG